MTTFTVSLFLPYTIDFKAGSSTREPGSPTAPVAPSHRDSLFEDPPSALDTPALEALFAPVDKASPRLHFSKPHDPRSLRRTESFTPEWGRSRVFNQPKSRVIAAPPSTILQYARAQSEQAAATLGQLTGSSTRSQSQDRNFADHPWTVEPSIQSNGGLINAVRDVIDKGLVDHISWVGSLGFPTDSLGDEKRSDIETKLDSDFDALTVFIDDKDFDGHYAHYCKVMLWPVFHYQIPDHPKSKAYEDHSYKHYVSVNQAFADRIVQSYKHNDCIWIHDYHLLLVPAMIRKILPDARIGFFLHTAFPSSEVFRCLAMRKELLEGMLGANLIAFQTHEYARHFLQTVSRILVVESTEAGVQLDDRFVDVASFPIGIVPEQIMAAREADQVHSWVAQLIERYKDKKLIVSRDKLDTIRGVRQKLLSYELFLNKNPRWRDKVVFIQVALSSSTDNQELQDTISNIVMRINSQHSTLAHQPIVFLKQDIEFSQYLALLTQADVMMITPLRDGMNLTCHEFLICQDGLGSSKKYGPLILSEFTGSSSVFQGNELSVNPWDHQQCSRAIKKALEMTEKEKILRYRKLRELVLQHTGTTWMLELVDRLAAAHKCQQLRDNMHVPRLSVNELTEKYKAASNRLFLLDYEDTLANWGATHPSNRLAPPQRVIEMLSDLMAASHKNTVYVASARTPVELERILHQVPNLGLIAENGCFVRPSGSEEWIDLADVSKSAIWKESILGVLEYYHERIEGSYIEERRCSIVFHYENVKGEHDIEAAARQMGDCAGHINDSLAEAQIRAVPVGKSVIVEPKDFSKMTAAKWVLNHLQKQNSTFKDASNSKKSAVDVDAQERPEPPMSDDGYFSDQPVRTGSISHPNSASETRTHSPEPVSRTSAQVGVPGRSETSNEERISQSKNSSKKDYSNNADDIPTETTHSTLDTDNVRKAGDDFVPDFLMVAGDGREDESVFRWANELGKASNGPIESVVTVCVGKRSTEAAFTLTQGVTGLVTALQKLVRS